MDGCERVGPSPRAVSSPVASCPISSLTSYVHFLFWVDFLWRSEKRRRRRDCGGCVVGGDGRGAIVF